MRSFRVAFILILLLVPIAFGWFQIYRSRQPEAEEGTSSQEGNPQVETMAPSSHPPQASPAVPEKKAAVTVEIYIPPADLPIRFVFRPVLARLDALEQEFPQTLQVIRHDLDDPATLQAMHGNSKLWGTTLVSGKDVHFLGQGNRKRKVVLRIKPGGGLQYTADDLEAVIRQALHRKPAAVSRAPETPGPPAAAPPGKRGTSSP